MEHTLKDNPKRYRNDQVAYLTDEDFHPKKRESEIKLSAKEILSSLPHKPVEQSKTQPASVKSTTMPLITEQSNP